MLTKTLVGTAVRLAQRPNEMPDMEFGYVFQVCPDCGDECVSKGYRVAFMSAYPFQPENKGVRLVAWCPCGAIFAITGKGTELLLSYEQHRQKLISGRDDLDAAWDDALEN